MPAKFGIFSLSQFPDAAEQAAGLKNDMEQYVLADELGYDTIWIAEHLFSNYGIVASGQVLAAAIAQRTSRIRIGTAVSIVPFNHPLRTASDFAAIDCMSGGRLNFGVGRAYQPHEFAALDVPMDKSREMFKEGMDIIIKSWTDPSIKYDGEFWKIKSEVSIFPTVIQKPYPPIYMAATSPPSYTEVAKFGWNILLAASISYRTFRERWIDAVADLLEGYERTCVESGRKPRAAERGLLIPFFVAPTKAKAREEFGTAVEWFFNRVSNLSSTTTTAVAGYEDRIRENNKTRELGLLNFDALDMHSAAVVGSPDECISKLKILEDKLGITEFILFFNLGGMPTDKVQQSMRLAMKEVIPEMKKSRRRPTAALASV